MGLAEGEVLKKSALQTVETELEQQYMQQGRYDADITVTTTPRPNNRVEVLIDFVEGKAAKVFDINIIGNTVFKESDIKQAFAVKESGWSSVISRNDRYAREKMAASLEALRAMYLNRGYINFNITNSSLNLSEDKRMSLLKFQSMKANSLSLDKPNSWVMRFINLKSYKLCNYIKKAIPILRNE